MPFNFHKDNDIFRQHCIISAKPTSKEEERLPTPSSKLRQFVISWERRRPANAQLEVQTVRDTLGIESLPCSGRNSDDPWRLRKHKKTCQPRARSSDNSWWRHVLPTYRTKGWESDMDTVTMTVAICQKTKLSRLWAQYLESDTNAGDNLPKLDDLLESLPPRAQDWVSDINTEQSPNGEDFL